MKYIVAGGRDFNNRAIMDKILSKYINLQSDIIISGCARGADTLGAEWAATHGVPLQTFPAQWEQYGKGAGYVRNAEMAAHADRLIAFWDGTSRGTHHMIVTMAKQNKPTLVFDYNGNLTEKHHYEDT